MEPKESLAYFHSLQPIMLAQLLEFVAAESPTGNKSAVDLFGGMVATRMEDIGMSVQTDSQEKRGDHLIGRWTGRGPKVLLIGHLDTVWEPGSLEKMPVIVQGDTAFGPGIFDMKSGIVIALFALRLMQLEHLDGCNITLLWNTDEEEHSDTSRALIEMEARDAAAVLVLEPAGPRNAVKTRRRGTGNFTVTVRGKAAHAGVEPDKGVNAVVELARQIPEIQKWNEVRRSISAHFTIIQGGARSNVIPDEAHAILDVRCDEMNDMPWVEGQLGMLKPYHPEARIEVSGSFNRPPMERTEKTVALYQMAADIAASFDDPICEFATGGASDGNFTAALGIPTLDGLGAQGQGAHAAHEQVTISSLPKRANLLYHLLKRLTA